MLDFGVGVAGRLMFSGAMALSVAAGAADYPAKPIRFIVPLSPGGPADAIARLVGKKLTESMAQPVVIDNRAGASTIIGTQIAAVSPPDGYTLLMVTTTHTVNPSVFRELAYDPIKDFTPVTMTASAPFLLAVHPSVAAHSLGEFVALARSKPGELNFASSGRGSSIHLTTELFMAAAKIEMAHVPYKGAGPAFIDVVAGHVQVLFSSTVSSLAYVRSGKLRSLAVTSLKRIAAAPGVPTVAESGFPGFESSSWNGVMLPARTPQPIIDRLNREIVAAVKTSEISAALASQGAQPGGNSPREFGAYFQSEMKKWAAVIRRANIKPE
jgi:tripartite-type tricarboxylate transporter receptor subunit TctC